MRNSNKQRVLVVSGADTPGAELTRWMETNDRFETVLAQTDEKAIELFQLQGFDAVIIDSSLSDSGFNKLRAVLPIFNSEVLVIGYYGETAEALQKKMELSYESNKLERMKRLIILDADHAAGQEGWLPFSDN
ncbi:MAG TPA: hypothetical protein VFR58_02560 [Flavisolibacter sp.]|nr:hypothetical protein [Flavisolibacter sp.]